MNRVRCFAGLLAAGALLLTTGCGTSQRYGKPGEPVQRLGDEIVVCGQLFHTGAPVVLWLDPGGYDAYRSHCHFKPEQDVPSRPVSKPGYARFGSWRRNLPESVAVDARSNGWRLEELQEHVDQFVIHYDVCGTSRQCFKVLHDIRGLSVQFMLDLDGTIYQTLDLKERAWHAGSANDRSVGIEIANIGAYTNTDTLEKWYAIDEDGRAYCTLPSWMGDGGIRTPDFVAYPSRNEIVIGEVQGKTRYQYDLTDEQYDSLVKLTATLHRVLPKIALDYPRDADGNLVNHVLDKDAYSQFQGLVGHFHVTKVKQDPGPAFDWDRVLDGRRDAL